MVRSGLAVNTGGATGNIDHMLALGTGDAAMTMEASGVLGTVRQALESGQYHVKIGVGPLPSLNGGGGVPVGDGSLWIPKAAAPAKRAAAWQFVKYLSSAKEQADLAASLGYVPVRRSATAVAELQQTWASETRPKRAHNPKALGPPKTPAAGARPQEYQGVRDAVKDGMLSMLTGGLSPQAALEKAQKQADASIKAYNTRLGVG